MKAIKLFPIAIGTVMMLTANITTVKAQTADEIIQKHIDAMGGVDNWSKIISIKRTGSISVQGMDIGYSQTVVNNKGMRTDFNAMGTSNYMIITPTEGWMYMPVQGMDKVTPIPADKLKDAAGKINIKNGMLLDKSEIAKAEYAGKDTVNNISCLKVKITDKDGNVSTDYFDAATYYLVRSEATAKGQDGTEQEVAMSFGDFQKQPEGIVLPMTMTSPMGGDANIVIKSVEINKPIGDNTFKPDPSDKK